MDTRLERQFQKEIALASVTTFKIGGPAKLFYTAGSREDLVAALDWGHSRGAPVFLIGGGSNLLVADDGFRGLVIKNTCREFEVLSEGPDFMTLRVGSGLGLSCLIETLFGLGVGILWKFAGIPGTVGGAVFGNAHGRDRAFGDFVVSGRIWSGGRVVEVDRDYFGFAYGESALKTNGDVLIDVTLRLPRSRNLAYQRFLGRRWLTERGWKFPRWPSAGCVFRNLTGEDQRRAGLPTASAGYFIEKVLGLKGQRVGGAEISNEHANFIVNRGGARARDVWDLIKMVETTGRGYGVELQREIQLLGDFA